MSDYTINISKYEQRRGSVCRWWLDYPVVSKSYSSDDLMNSGIIFQGWVLFDFPCQAQVYIKQGTEVEFWDFNHSRPDVIKAILKQDFNKHPQLNCGFRFQYKLHAQNFELGVKSNGELYPLVLASIDGPFKVISGQNGWLFLDNDTNKSVEQFTGKLLLDSKSKASWFKFMQDLLDITDKLNCKHALLIAPSKEFVYEKFYPFKKANITPIEQVLKLAPKTINICYPDKILKLAKERSYRLTDTHWSPYGAMLASIALVESLGISINVESLFEDDEYREVDVVGDLGNKVFPAIFSKEKILKSFSYRKFLVFDNNLANFGRTMILENEDAPIKGHLVIFGASSSYSMLDYLSRVFSKITLMHTAGNIDSTILAKLLPDYLVCQSNARYVIRAPIANYDLEEVIKVKLSY